MRPLGVGMSMISLKSYEYDFVLMTCVCKVDFLQYVRISSLPFFSLKKKQYIFLFQKKCDSFPSLGKWKPSSQKEMSNS